jgi:hypothetical protein
MIACYNGHFETELAIDKNRFCGPPPQHGFALLVNDRNTGKVTTASYQSVAYGDTTFYAIGPFGAHTITRDARSCSDCHNNETIQAYNANGTIDVARRDEGTSRIVNTKGILPIPEDWQTALQFDFVRFTGDPSDPIDNPGDPTKWEFMKT